MVTSATRPRRGGAQKTFLYGSSVYMYIAGPPSGPEYTYTPVGGGDAHKEKLRARLRNSLAYDGRGRFENMKPI